MAHVSLMRGGTPDFKGWFTDGQYSEFYPPFDAVHQAGTPPFDSHADGAYGQGYLNLHFPLVPNLAGTEAHRQMRSALKGLKAVGDIIRLNWIPTRSYLDSWYIEVSNTDAVLDGVYFMPVVERVAYDYTTEEFVYTENTAANDEIIAAKAVQMPMGTPLENDKRYAFIRFSTDPTVVPSTFGHNIIKRDDKGRPTGGLDDYFGANILGLKIVAGEPDAIAKIWKSDVAVYTSAKLLAFEGATQVG